MKTLKLEFYEKKTQKRSDGSPITLEFRGNWENNGLMPSAKLTFTGCDEETANAILNSLELAAPGEFLFLNKGVNPQRKLDDWLGKAVKRKSPSIVSFESQIVDFTEDEKKERYESLYQELHIAVDDGREDSKKFDFLFECLNHLRKDIWPALDDMTKEEFVGEIREPKIDTSEELSPEEEQPKQPKLAEDPTDEGFREGSTQPEDKPTSEDDWDE